MNQWDAMKAVAYETMPLGEAALAVDPLNDSQKAELIALGKTGALAVPLSGWTLEEAATHMNDAAWRLNWRVWMEPGYAPHLRFIKMDTAMAGGA